MVQGKDIRQQSEEDRPQSGGGSRKEKPRSAATARVKLQIDLPGGGRLGPGKIALLELIESEGSLSRAAEVMGISYRRAWLFVQQINAAFEDPAVATPQGGHGGAAARVTEFGRELAARFRRLEDDANARGQAVLGWLAERERKP